MKKALYAERVHDQYGIHWAEPNLCLQCLD